LQFEIMVANKKDSSCKMAQKFSGNDYKVQLEKLNEGSCVQMLHVGPYDEERKTIALMLAFAEKAGLSCYGLHHEIYLSDPRRVAPKKLKTILRMPVK